ncbi:ATP synthase mitochondrial F1 complex assembly factor 1 [Heteronotia binoei]|uniref:ATP synthase mitochondrial F1 complex assembly factor 1 n=1 Tax=Heteronotia binoei TaxID=13085 RepID=UPI0029316731|nr:ATP synthase mitochondrial F1 complex assembly factor 1 [Heteronotia binoei]
MWADRKGMAARYIQQLCGAAVLGLSRGVLVGRFASLRPLGMLLPPQPRPLVMRVQGMGGDGAVEENPFYAKYQRKIQELRKSNPDIFATRMERRSDEKKQPMGYSKQAEFVRFMEEKADALGNKTSKGGFTKNKTLDSILNVEIVKQKKPEEIKQIWKQYFSGEDTVYAVIPGKTFDLIWKRAQHCPSFLFALPRKEGYEFFVGQWSGAELHFSSLINIQTQGETATSQLILYHYPELQEDKGIVLMTAEMDSSFLNVPEAQCLASQVQLFYATDRQETYNLVETFNHQPDQFKYMSVITELEQSRLGQELRPQQDPPMPTA